MSTPKTIQTTNYYSNRKCESVGIYIMWVDKGQDECGGWGGQRAGRDGWGVRRAPQKLYRTRNRNLLVNTNRSVHISRR